MSLPDLAVACFQGSYRISIPDTSRVLLVLPSYMKTRQRAVCKDRFWLMSAKRKGEMDLIFPYQPLGCKTEYAVNPWGLKTVLKSLYL